ncbi:Cytoplasmic and mitochondrial histidine tRNA synthetase [Coelomomyces lativittatus]|nr:Cytoplasmic and mitochondrial histidine tRNA synthetase [Coelomomyces lativittatus]
MASKGLAVTSIDLIHHFVTMKGKKEIIDYLRTQTSITQTHALGAALDELELLLEYLEVFGVQDKVVLDLSLARGLDYYTGVIFEAVLVNEPTTREIREKKPSSSSSSSSSKSKTTQVDDDVSEDVGIGSIAAGGRYDDLVGTLAGPSKKGGDLRSCPCVGLSIGVERLCAVLWQRQCRYPSTKTQVYVMSVGSNVDGGYIKERMQLCQCLWDAKIPATFMYKCKPRLQSQFTQCEKEKIPWAVLIGEDELKSGHVRIKKMSEKSVGPEAAGILVKRDQMVMELKKRLTATSTTSTHDVEQMGVTLEQCKV